MAQGPQLWHHSTALPSGGFGCVLHESDLLQVYIKFWPLLHTDCLSLSVISGPLLSAGPVCGPVRPLAVGKELRQIWAQIQPLLPEHNRLIPVPQFPPCRGGCDSLPHRSAVRISNRGHKWQWARCPFLSGPLLFMCESQSGSTALVSGVMRAEPREEGLEMPKGPPTSAAPASRPPPWPQCSPCRCMTLKPAAATALTSRWTSCRHENQLERRGISRNNFPAQWSGENWWPPLPPSFQ